MADAPKSPRLPRRAPAAPPPVAHTMRYRVCYADTDRMDRVYYGHYFTLFERSRTELLRDAGLPYAEMERREFFLPIRHCEARYHGFAVYDDMLLLHSWVTRLRHATVTFETLVRREGEDRALVHGAVELACIGPSGRPRPFPEDAVAALAPFRVDAADTQSE